MSKQFHKILLGSAAAVVLTVAAGGAQAQVQSPGWFGSLTGWYYFDSGNDKLRDDGDNPVFRASASPHDGWGGRAYAGYRFSNPYDIAFGLQGSWLSKGKKNAVCCSGDDDDDDLHGTQKADYWLGDIEVGYNGSMDTTGYRLFIGLRYAEFDHRTRLNSPNWDGYTLTYKNDYWGVGPRIGASVSHRFGPTSNFSIFADVSGSVLFGKLKGRYHESDDDPVIHDKGSRTVWNADGQIGLAYEIAPMVNLAVGYRAEFWNGVADKHVADNWGPTVTLARGGSADRFMHGPFARISYNIGAPKGAPAPVAAPAPVMAKSFIVFFDFDRSVLTPTALGTIKQAADAAKAGKSARVNVTGHADKSGADQYNMALSLRRANAVKDELVRQGVPAASIVVVGRGESQPLVPTADGVKEPQNRRVEIVLN